jgi:hypothetical protein
MAASFVENRSLVRRIDEILVSVSRNELMQLKKASTFYPLSVACYVAKWPQQNHCRLYCAHVFAALSCALHQW